MSNKVSNLEDLVIYLDSCIKIIEKVKSEITEHNFSYFDIGIVQ